MQAQGLDGFKIGALQTDCWVGDLLAEASGLQGRIVSGSSGSFMSRVGSAPISWGICEVPGWGAQLPVDRFLAEMTELGLHATELGSIGYLPTDPDELRRLLDSHGMRLTGGFNALCAPRPARTESMLAGRDCQRRSAGCGRSRPASSRARSPTPTAGSVRCSPTPSGRCSPTTWPGSTRSAPSVGSSRRSTRMSIRSSRPPTRSSGSWQSTSVGFVLETGHMLIGGMDPLAFARRARRPCRAGAPQGCRRGSDRAAQPRRDVADGGRSGGDLPGARPGRLADRRRRDGARTRPVPRLVHHRTRRCPHRWPPGRGEGPVRDVQQSVAYLESIVSTIGHELTNTNKGEIPV